MARYIILCYFLFAAGFTTYAQNVQVGIGVAGNNTFFHKGSSQYEEENTGGAIYPGAGALVALNLRLTDVWTLRSGLGFHIKQYRVLTDNFDLDGIDGFFNFYARFNCLEVPVILGYKTAKQKEYKFEYRLGLVSSYYMPVQTGTGFELEGSVPASMGIVSPEPAWQNTYSPDIYLGVALLKNKNNTRRHEFSVSYQYGLLPTSEFRYTAWISTGSTARVYRTTLVPNLSSFMLSYVFYPNWLSFGRLGAAE
jgi:hypothetical protein